jgi:hypothetical protein
MIRGKASSTRVLFPLQEISDFIQFGLKVLDLGQKPDET